MGRYKRNNRTQLKQANPKKITRNNALQVASSIVPKATSRLRADIATWKSALTLYENADNPKSYAIHNLYKLMKDDALLSSQIQNRKLKVVGSGYILKRGAETNDELTDTLQKSTFFNSIIEHVWDSVSDGHTLLEFDTDGEKYRCSLIPRQNVIPSTKTVLFDYSDDKGVKYAEAAEYGTWLIDFGRGIGIINKAIPHILYKRFAQSCWSELCEIFGIPPRVMKTNTSDPASIRRAEQMMRDMGAAASFIIDDTETIEFADGVSSDGSVYENLIKLCNNEISMLISGAIIGQDGKYGSRGKEQSSQEVLADIVHADKRMVEMVMNDVALPALYQCGFIGESDIKFEFDKSEDLDELWTRTKEVLPYKNVENEWLKNKFGIEITGDRQTASPELKLPDDDFFF